MKNWEMILADAGVELLLETPFLGHLFAQLPRRLHPECGDLALSPREDYSWCLLVRPSWIETQPFGHVLYLLKHELFHWALGHPGMKGFYPDEAVFSAVADLQVESFLGPPPPGVPVLSPGLLVFQDEGMPEGRQEELEVLYTQYLAEPEKLHAFQEACPQAFLRHIHWENAKGLESGLKMLPEEKRRWALKQALDASPAAVLQELPEVLRLQLGRLSGQAAQMDWRSLLRRFAKRLGGSRLRQTWRKPSKRYGAFPGYKVVGKPLVYAVIDTSASVSEGQLGLFLEEIGNLAVSGAAVVVVECDTQVRRMYRFKGNTHPEILGRGGTLYDEPIRLANEKWRPGLMVYFTDGEGPKPVLAPDFPLLWVLGGRKRPLSLPGKIVWMTLPVPLAN